MRHSPSLPEIVRIETADLNSTISQLVSILQPGGAGFNYIDATKRLIGAYKGFHELDQLTAIVGKGVVGQKENIDVVRLAAPYAFGRNTHVFDFPKRTVSYYGRVASYRASFFFVENGVFKLHFLQPRKNTVFTHYQFRMLATVMKNYLLDTEFFGEQCDVEFVDVSKNEASGQREARLFSLGDLPPVKDHEVNAHFGMIADALAIIENENLVPKARRPLKDVALPLFD